MIKTGKTIVYMLIIIVLACTMVSCKSTGYPRFVQDALKNVPGDVLVGIGTANLTDMHLAMITATSRAMVEISRQIHSIVIEMVTSYQLSGNGDSRAVLSFQESIILTLSQSNLVGAQIIKRDRARDGSAWAVILMDKENVMYAISQAQIAAQQAVPEMDSFDARDWLDVAFAETAAQEYQVNDG